MFVSIWKRDLKIQRHSTLLGNKNNTNWLSPGSIVNYISPKIKYSIQGVSLYVVKPPAFTNTTESEVSLMIGTQARLFCQAAGEPEPSITWSRSGGHTINLQHRGGHSKSFGTVLQLGKLTPRDSGDYSCIAKNGHPPTIVKSIRLNVMCKIYSWKWKPNEMFHRFRWPGGVRHWGRGAGGLGTESQAGLLSHGLPGSSSHLVQGRSR